MSLRGNLLEALTSYHREVRNTPGQQDLVAQLEEVAALVKRAPDPKPTESGAPPERGQDAAEGAPGAPGADVSGGGQVVINLGWPSKERVVARLKGRRA
jgi:hypothetical protein